MNRNYLAGVFPFFPAPHYPSTRVVSVAKNRLVSMETRSDINTNVPQIQLDFAYDYLGRRIGKTVDGTTNTFVYDGWNLIAELSNDGTNYYVDAIDGLFCKTTCGTEINTFFYEKDGLGNIVRIRNTLATVIADYEYDSFGNIIRSTGSQATNNIFQYGGHIFDSETKLLYARYRYYSPTLERFLQRDPLGEGGGINLYCFALNNPLTFIDPLGLAPYASGTFNTRNWTPHPQKGRPTASDRRKLAIAYSQAPWIWLFSRPANVFHYNYLFGNGAGQYIDFGEVIEDEKKNSLKNDITWDVLDAIRYADSFTVNGDIQSASWQLSDTLTRKWFWALNKVLWSGNGKVEVSGSCRTLRLRYHLWDPYNFDYTDDPVGLLKDRDYRRFHDVGLADEFLILGESAVITVQWSKGNYKGIKASQLNFRNGSNINF